jgi:RimJ/RimL family protein N-acetyltransferase
MPLSLADWPVPIPPVHLLGRVVRLEPLGPDHEAELRGFSDDGEIWRYLTSRVESPGGMREYLDASLRAYRAGTALPFVVRAASGGGVIGMTRLKSLSRENRKAVVGSWFAPAAWGSGANTESKLLLLGHAFESLACLRVEFQTDSRNTRSRAALARIGAVEEGTLRSYLLTADGHRRDSVIFSVLAEEWPGVKRALLSRLETQLIRSR